MSRSINDLLGSLGVKTQQPTEGELYNPDIPAFEAKRATVRDKYYSDMKLPTEPRNGSGYDLDGRPGRVENPKHDDFMLEGAIDPNVIRKKHNPKSANPYMFSAGAQNMRFAAADTESHDQLGLIQAANQSYVNYKHRFDLPQPKIGGQPVGLTPWPQKHIGEDLAESDGYVEPPPYAY